MLNLFLYMAYSTIVIIFQPLFCFRYIINVSLIIFLSIDYEAIGVVTATVERLAMLCGKDIFIGKMTCSLSVIKILQYWRITILQIIFFVILIKINSFVKQAAQLQIFFQQNTCCIYINNFTCSFRLSVEILLIYF